MQGILDACQGFRGIRLFSAGDSNLTVGSVFRFVVGLAASLIAGVIVRRLTSGIMARWPAIAPGIRYTIARTTQFVLVAVGVIVILWTARVDLTVFAI